MNIRFLGFMAFAVAFLLPAAALADSAYPSSSSTADRTAVVNRLQKQERMDEFRQSSGRRNRSLSRITTLRRG